MVSNELAAELAAISNVPKRGACGVLALGFEMPPDDYAACLEAIADRKKPAAAITQVLRAHGYHIGDQVIQRHRRGACSCR